MVHTYANANEQKLSKVHPRVKDLALSFLADVDVDVMITHGLRTFAEQAALYAKGRTAAGKIVTYAQAGRSYHNYGLAIDFVPLNLKKQAIWNTTDERWERAIKVAESKGFESGARWEKLKDYPHLQLTFGLSTKELAAMYATADRSMTRLWNELNNLT